MDDVVAERELTIVGSPSRKVIVRILKPVEDPGGDWICAHRIVGLGDDLVGVTHGVDSMQAMQLALEQVRVILAESKERFAWGGDDEMGAGMPRSIPMVLPRSYAASLEEAIDRTVARWAEDLKCRYDRKRER